MIAELEIRISITSFKFLVTSDKTIEEFGAPFFE